MKKKFFYSMLAAATMLVSCSSEDEVVNNNPFSENEDGYVAFNIQLPQANGTTRSNDEFHDGNPLPTEYQVRNATLFLFTGTTESAAKFCGAYTMNVKSFTEVGTPTDQCSTEGKVSTKISTPAIATNLYAYVIINHNGLVANPSATSVDVITYNGTSTTTTTVGTTTDFATFSQLVLNNIGNDTQGYLMTNCPVNDATAGASEPTTKNVTVLTKLDSSKIKATESDAEANPAGEIFVERAAVKVTVNTSMSGTTPTTGTPSVNFDADNFKWALQNENQAYYNARQMTASWLALYADGSDGTPNTSTKYRFASGSAIHNIDGVDIVRTYWGTDVNYNVDMDNTITPPTYKFQTLPAGVSYINKAKNTSAYTFENTFDVDRQSSKNTTQVAISVPFNNGEDFYTASTNGDNNILQAPGYTGSEKKIHEYIMEYLCANNAAFNTWYSTKGENRITVTMVERLSPSNGYHKVHAVTRGGSADALPSGITESELVTLINDAMKFKYYKDGVAYYRVRIKHFGAELSSGAETPWDVTKHSTNSIIGVYKTINGSDVSSKSDGLYLGRYGVLRNNWYQLEVTAIKNIGYPLPGDPSKPGNPNDPDNPNPWTPDTPDDEVENYIAVKIHVTPWALRKQSVIL